MAGQRRRGSESGLALEILDDHGIGRLQNVAVLRSGPGIGGVSVQPSLFRHDTGPGHERESIRIELQYRGEAACETLCHGDGG